MGSAVESKFRVDWVKLYSEEHVDLSSLDGEFTLEEIKLAVFSLPTDKSPDPDGFSMGFYQNF